MLLNRSRQYLPLSTRKNATENTNGFWKVRAKQTVVARQVNKKGLKLSNAQKKEEQETTKKKIHSDRTQTKHKPSAHKRQEELYRKKSDELAQTASSIVREGSTNKWTTRRRACRKDWIKTAQIRR